MWNILLGKLMENRDRFVPKAKERKSGDQVWITSRIRKNI